MNASIELQSHTNIDALAERTFTTVGGLTLTVELAWHSLRTQVKALPVQVPLRHASLRVH